MPPAGFEPTIPAGKPLQTNAVDRAATGIGMSYVFTAIFLHSGDGHVNVWGPG